MVFSVFPRWDAAVLVIESDSVGQTIHKVAPVAVGMVVCFLFMVYNCDFLKEREAAPKILFFFFFEKEHKWGRGRGPRQRILMRGSIP